MNLPYPAFLNQAAPAGTPDERDYTVLCKTGAVAYLSARQPGGALPQLLVARAHSPHMQPDAARELANELALRERLDPAWALAPVGSVSAPGSLTLLYADADAVSLAAAAPRRLSVTSFLALAPQMARALHGLHRAGLAHGNLNAGCFFIDAAPRPSPQQSPYPAPAGERRVRLGGFGMAAPARHATDTGADLHALGEIYYLLLAGRAPAADAAQCRSPRAFNRAIPERLSRLVMRMLAQDAAQCWPGAEEVAQALEQYACALPAPAPAVPLANRSASRKTILSRDATAATDDSHDIDALLRAMRALSAELDLEQLRPAIAGIACELTGAWRCLLLLRDEGRSYIEAEALASGGAIEINTRRRAAGEGEMSLGMLELALEGGSVCAGNDGSLLQSAAAHDDEDGACRALCIALTHGGEVPGALYLVRGEHGAAFDARQLTLARRLAAHAAICLHNALAHARLRRENEQLACAEQALRTSQELLKQGERFNHTGSMRYLVREDLMFCSDELCRIYGLEDGRNCINYEEFAALMHPDDRQEVIDTVDAAVAMGGTIRVEHRICRRDTGEVRYISGIGKPVWVDGTFVEYVGTATDITVRRQAEYAMRVAQADLERVSRANTVGQLTASIAHEINQPLMSIVSNAGASLRWLDRDPPNLDNARAGLRDIVAEGQRAGGMIAGLQGLTRNTEPVFARVDVNAAIRHILTISKSELERREVSLVLALAPEETCALGDLVQLQQVLLNLVVNAVEAMAEVRDRPRTLTVSSACTGDQRVEVAVQDTGEGIAPDAMPRVFDAFYTTKENGMGMGLAICRSIVENHRGRIRVAGAQPCGTVFRFDMPRVP
ncbi:ATP-binding protein [Herbaspirillum robiniae]|nr:ATP-binding protein [Herbaspirillum robiniae]